MNEIIIKNNQIENIYSSKIKIWGLNLLERKILELNQKGYTRIYIQSDIDVEKLVNKINSLYNLKISIFQKQADQVYETVLASSLHSPKGELVAEIKNLSNLNAAKRDLLKSIEKKQVPKTKFFLRYVYRPNGKFLLNFFILLPITPSFITLLSLTLGLISATLYALGNLMLAAFLLHFSVSLDCVDGRMARLKYKTSNFGHWLDASSDQVKIHSIYIGILIYFSVRQDLIGIFFSALLLFGSISTFFSENYSDNNENKNSTNETQTNLNLSRTIVQFFTCFENRIAVIFLASFHSVSLLFATGLLAIIYNIMYLRMVIKQYYLKRF